MMTELYTLEHEEIIIGRAVPKTLIRPTLPVSTYLPDPDTVSLPNSQPCGRHAPQALDNRKWRNDKHYDYPISRDHSYSATDNELANHDSRQSSARTSPAKLLTRALPGRWFAAHDGRQRTRISIRSQDLFGWQGGRPLGLHQRSRVNLDFPCRAWNRFSLPTLQIKAVHKSRSKIQGIFGMEPRYDRRVRILMPRGYLIQPKWFRIKFSDRTEQNGELTTSGSGQLRQSQDCIVTWNGFKGNIWVPQPFPTLLLLIRIKDAFKDLPALHGWDYTNFVVFTSVLTTSIHNWMDMQLWAGRFSRELAETMSQLLLKVIVQAILRTKEDDAALWDWWVITYNQPGRYMNGDRYGPVIARSLSSSSELGALNHSATFASGNSFPITGVTSNDLNWSSTPFSSRGFG